MILGIILLFLLFFVIYKKKSNTILFILMMLITINIGINFMYIKNPLILYNGSIGNTEETNYIDGKIDNSGMVSELSFENGKSYKIDNYFNVYMSDIQYYTDDSPAYISTINYKIKNSLISILGGIPFNKEGHIIELHMANIDLE